MKVGEISNTNFNIRWVQSINHYWKMSLTTCHISFLILYQLGMIRWLWCFFVLVDVNAFFSRFEYKSWYES